MRRYSLWLLALVFGVLGVGISVQAQAPAATRTLSIATLAPPGSTWMRIFDAWNREVRRRSNKTLALRFYPGGVQGDEAEVIRKIRSGRLDGGAVTAVGLAQIHRPALVFQMPGMFRGYAQLDNARTQLHNEMNTAFEAAGFQLMGWADVGQSRIFSQTPVRTPQELAAQRPWVWRDDAVLPALFQVIRVNPVPLQVPEVLSALQTNRINALITSPVAAISLQWASRLTHMTDVPVAVVIGATVFGRNQWNSLTPDQQTIMRETALQFHALARRNLRNDEQQALATLPQRNVTVVPVDAGQRAQWDSVFQQTRQRLTGQIADAAFIARVQQLGR
jgi:TRAP-type C4-dicarboxylate transport system substrate-binding protein